MIITMPKITKPGLIGSLGQVDGGDSCLGFPNHSIEKLNIKNPMTHKSSGVKTNGMGITSKRGSFDDVLKVDE